MEVFIGFLFVAGIVAAMVLLYLKVIPKKLDGTFGSKFVQFLHDYFNFKKLYVESVLKFVFTLATVACVVGGVAGIIGSVLGFFGGILEIMNYGSWYFEYVVSSLITGILGSLVLLVLGPVVVRLTYEFTMMFILLVKNVMELNNKVKGEDKPEELPAE